VSPATGTRTAISREVLVKGFDALNAGAKPFAGENLLLVEQAVLD
jgi:hypothetical protein